MRILQTGKYKFVPTEQQKLMYQQLPATRVTNSQSSSFLE